MASLAMLIRGAAINALAFSGSNYQRYQNVRITTKQSVKDMI